MIKNEKIEVLEEDETGNGSHLMGNISITYNELVELFNEPHETYSDKTDVEWNIKFDGTPFYIYNYKDGKNYLGEIEGRNVEFIEDWHIGGFNKEKADELIEWIKENRSGAEDVIEDYRVQEILDSIVEDLGKLDIENLFKVRDIVNKLV